MYMIFFDLVTRFFMNLLEIWTRCLVSDPELNFDINWPTFDIAYSVFYLLYTVKGVICVVIFIEFELNFNIRYPNFDIIDTI
jgi:hypothetical protein